MADSLSLSLIKGPLATVYWTDVALFVQELKVSYFVFPLFFPPQQHREVSWTKNMTGPKFSRKPT